MLPREQVKFLRVEKGVSTHRSEAQLRCVKFFALQKDVFSKRNKMPTVKAVYAFTVGFLLYANISCGIAANFTRHSRASCRNDKTLFIVSTLHLLACEQASLD